MTGSAQSGATCAGYPGLRFASPRLRIPGSLASSQLVSHLHQGKFPSQVDARCCWSRPSGDYVPVAPRCNNCGY